MTIKTLNGTEISIQLVLRIDHEFVAIKGRLAGTQDTGRLFLIPYAQIDHLAHLKEIKESDFSETFDSLKMPEASATSLRQESTGVAICDPERTIMQLPQPLPPAISCDSSDSAIGAAVTPVVRTGPGQLKSAVLERFRNRPGSGSNPGVRPPQG